MSIGSIGAVNGFEKKPNQQIKFGSTETTGSLANNNADDQKLKKDKQPLFNFGSTETTGQLANHAGALNVVA